jgi:DUF1680 family protein
MSALRGVLLALSFSCLFSITSAGDLVERYRLTVERVRSGGPPVYDPPMVLADLVPRSVRRFTDFGGDVSGRYIGAAASTGLIRGESWPLLDEVVDSALRLQKPEGYFGAALDAGPVSDRQMALLWGNGRLLIGLIEYHRMSGSPAALQAARRLADWMISMAPVLNSVETQRAFNDGKLAVGYICWTQNMEGLVALFELTRDPRYRILAEQMAARTERRPGQHSHGHLTSLRGVLRLYEVTRDDRFLGQVEQQWHEVVASGNLLPHGAVPEAYYPDIKRDEGCSEADWLRLSLGLWRITGKLEYLEAAERTLFNEYAANQFASGDFGHRVQLATGIGSGVGREGSAARAWWCCTLHGLRGFSDVFQNAFSVAGSAIRYDLPVDSTLKSPGVTLTADSRLGRDATIHLHVTAADGRSHGLLIRLPRWSSGIAVTLAGRALSAPEESGYLRLERAWRPGDELVLHYRMRTFVEAYTPPESAKAQTGRVLVFHGPWSLGVDEAHSPHYFDEPFALNKVELPASGEVALEPARETVMEPFAIPVARFRVKYFPGGYPSQPQTAVLRPLAEQTGLHSTAWEFLLRPATSGR